MIQTEPQRIIIILKARAIERHNLEPRTGRLEELQVKGNPRLGMSVSYGCRSIRVRFMQGRQWVSFFDLPAKEIDQGHLALFDEKCSAHFGSVGRVQTAVPA